MDDGSGMTCNEYIGTLAAPLTPAQCEVDLHFLYTIRNIGTLCGLVNQVTSIVDEDTTIISNSIADDLILPGDEFNFCPTEEKELQHGLIDVDICDLAGNLVPLALEVDHEGLDANGDLADFDLNAIVDLDYHNADFFEIEVDSIAECNLDDGSGMTCNEYIQTLVAPVSEDDCLVDLHFLYTIRNIGSLCGLIKQAKSVVDEDTTVISDSITGDLIMPGEEFQFCPTEEKELKHEIVDFNLCSFAGKLVPLSLEGWDVEVDLSNLGPGIGDGIDIGDLDIDLNLNIPFPELASPQCTAEPDNLAFGFTFQVEERRCSDSDNSQWSDFRRQLRSDNKNNSKKRSKGKGRGKGSVKEVKDCEQMVPTMPCDPWVEITSTNGKVDFSEYVSYGSQITISSENCDIEDLHILVKDTMGGQVVQKFSIDTTKVCIGDIFGILSLIGLDFVGPS